MDIIDAVPMTFISLAKKAKKVKVKKVKVKKVKAKTVKAKTLKDSVKAQGEFKGKKVKESVEESVEVVKTKKNTYQDLAATSVQADEILYRHFTDILVTMHRRIAANRGLLGPRRREMVVREKIVDVVFDAAWIAISESLMRVDVDPVEKLKKNKELKERRITFTHLHSFRYHMGKLAKLGSFDLEDNFLNRDLGGGNRGSIVCEVGKPIIFTWLARNSMLDVSCHFVVFNKQGNVVV